MNGWFHVVIAALFETMFIWSVRAGAGIGRPRLLLLMVVAIAGAGFFLESAFHYLPTGVAYPVWIGLGSLSAVLIGTQFYGEVINRSQLSCFVLILCSIAGLFATGVG